MYKSAAAVASWTYTKKAVEECVSLRSRLDGGGSLVSIIKAAELHSRLNNKNIQRIHITVLHFLCKIRRSENRNILGKSLKFFETFMAVFCQTNPLSKDSSRPRHSITVC